MQAERDQQNGQKNDAEPLDEIRPVRGCDATQHAVQSHDDGHDRDQGVFGLYSEKLGADERYGYLSDRREEHRAVDHVIETPEDGIGYAHLLDWYRSANQSPSVRQRMRRYQTALIQ